MKIKVYVSKGYIKSDAEVQLLQSEINKNLRGIAVVNIEGFEEGMNPHIEKIMTQLNIDTNFPFAMEVVNLVQRCFNKLKIENKFQNLRRIQMKNNKIKVNRIMETTYEDGTHWVEYQVNGRYAYEITEEFTENDIELYKKKINSKGFDTSILTEKIDIKTCSELMQDIVDECRGSDNEMWFVEEDEVTVEEVKQLEKEIESLGLEGYITTYEDGCAITVYGGAITKFIF